MELENLDVNFEVSSTNHRIIIPANTSLFEFEQSILYKLNLDAKRKKNINIIRLDNELQTESYKKELTTLKLINIRKNKIVIDLDALVGILLEDLKSNNMIINNQNESDLYNNRFKPNLLKESLIISSESSRGNIIQTQSCACNGKKLNLSMFNLKMYRNINFISHDLISFSGLYHRNIVQPVARIIDINLSQFAGKTLYQNLMPNLENMITLEQRIQEDFFNDSEKWLILYNLCDILEYFHKINKIHGNIAPFNILIDETTSINLIDFGISEHWNISDDDLSQSNKLLYDRNINYIPPEYYSYLYLSRLLPENDIWSIGCLIYYIFTKKNPWNDLNPDQIKNAIMNNEVFYLESQDELSENNLSALFLIRECCKYDFTKRIDLKFIKSFILLNSEKLCPQMLEKLNNYIKNDNLKMNINSNDKYLENYELTFPEENDCCK